MNVKQGGGQSDLSTLADSDDHPSDDESLVTASTGLSGGQNVLAQTMPMAVEPTISAPATSLHDSRPPHSRAVPDDAPPVQRTNAFGGSFFDGPSDAEASTMQTSPLKRSGSKSDEDSPSKRACHSPSQRSPPPPSMPPAPGREHGLR